MSIDATTQGASPAVPTQAAAIPVARVFLVVLAIWAMLMVVPDLYRVFASLASFGLVADNDGVIINVVGPFE